MVTRGDRGVLQGEPVRDQELADPGGAGGPDVVLGEDLEHPRAGHAGDTGHRERAQREGWQAEGHEPLPPRRREPAEADGEHQDQEEPEPVDRRWAAF